MCEWTPRGSHLGWNNPDAYVEPVEMSTKVLERVFGPGWRKKLDAIRWKAEHQGNERRKRTQQRLKHQSGGSDE